MGVNSVVVSTTFGAHRVIDVDRGAITNRNNLVPRECSSRFHADSERRNDRFSTGEILQLISDGGCESL